MIVSKKLQDYIENNIYPLYEDNYIGDDVSRIQYVINRSEMIIKENNLDVNNDILYAIIAFHDIRKNSKEDSHELTSAEILENDEFINKYFSRDQIIIMKEAIEDQRAKSEKEPRSIYGKLLSSASRNSSIEQCFERSYRYGKKKNPNATEEEIFNGAYEALLDKFGHNGYAKFYFKDTVYENFLKDIRKLLENKNEFINVHKNYINNKK